MTRMGALLLGAWALGLSGCAARSAALPVVDLRFSETKAEAAPKERVRQRLSLNVTLIGDAKLRYQKPSELLKVAETEDGGDPHLLMRAARTLSPGEGVVLLGTARSQESRGGSATGVLVYQLALACERTSLDSPGDLKGCSGYLLRAPRTWPAEVYEIESATVSVIPERGTATGRIRARSAPGGFKVDVEGEFSASIVELNPDPGLAAAPGE